MKRIISTAEMAKALSSLGLGEVAFVHRQVRHWTTQGLIPTVGEVNPGTGNSRIYDWDGLLLAAIFCRLSRLSVNVRTMRMASKTLPKDLVHQASKYTNPGILWRFDNKFELVECSDNLDLDNWLIAIKPYLEFLHPVVKEKELIAEYA